jgi:hypothetical protein
MLSTEWVTDVLQENIALKEPQCQSYVPLVATAQLTIYLHPQDCAMLGIIAPEVKLMVQQISVLKDITVNRDLVSLCLAWVVPTTI